MGVGECLNHHLVKPYNVLHEKEGKVRHYMTGFIHIRVKCYTPAWWEVGAGSTVCSELVKSYTDLFEVLGGGGRHRRCIRYSCIFGVHDSSALNRNTAL